MKLSAKSLTVLAASVSATNAFNLLDIPQNLLGAVDNLVASGFAMTPVSPQLADAAHDLGINPKWLPDSIRKYWKDMASDVASYSKKPQSAFRRVKKVFLSEESKKPKERKKQRVSRRTDFDLHVKSEKFPMHALRVKTNTAESLGLDSVKQYTGYFDVDGPEDDSGKHLFFWFFESRNDPKTDPILVWLNGGPGCSSLMGMLYELGPSSILTPVEKPELNPYSWNNNASVIFLDQPAGVGFSYFDSENVPVSDTRASAVDVYAFLSLFFQQFPEYKDLGLNIAGESYAGHYIPAISTEILKHTDRNFVFKSVLIGNGWTDTYHQSAGYGPMACGKGGYKPVLSEEQCAKFNHTEARCRWLDGLCYKRQDRLTCVPATYVCDSLLDPYIDTGLNPYDIRKPCVGSQDMCYDDIDYYANYLNKPKVQAAIGAEVENYEGCSDPVFNAFIHTGDGGKPFHFDVVEALAQGLEVLVYAGDKDYICNWVGQVKWLDALEWPGADEWAAGKFASWATVDDGEAAGEYKKAGNLTFVRVYDAGHMVPYDQPKHALDMVMRWLHGGRSFA
ncbi:uncharacterized protein SAPINGB_P003636 [Magnusiomyces paraingens]|uniref:Carboxypeptidase n=1 Tax=Magnusiomyces paraingens TaxID=2606893 RepID=A0A5E8BR86_9ASCO|nr:uncharacterized protein SAPINGB_P003636 [Saprochaete ingens]VVT53561.1 unnamed protein product [Saprochaete ingens]